MTGFTRADVERGIDEWIRQASDRKNVQYVDDKDFVQLITRGNHLRAGVLVFVGAKDVRFWNWETGLEAPRGPIAGN